MIGLFQAESTELEGHDHLALDVGQHRQRARREALLDVRLAQGFLHRQGRRWRRDLLHVDVGQRNGLDEELRQHSRTLLIEHSKIAKQNRRAIRRAGVGRGRNHVRIDDDTGRNCFASLTEHQDEKKKNGADRRHVQEKRK